jgi:hypothetical protein
MYNEEQLVNKLNSLKEKLLLTDQEYYALYLWFSVIFNDKLVYFISNDMFPPNDCGMLGASCHESYDFVNNLYSGFDKINEQLKYCMRIPIEKLDKKEKDFNSLNEYRVYCRNYSINLMFDLL